MPLGCSLLIRDNRDGLKNQEISVSKNLSKSWWAVISIFSISGFGIEILVDNTKNPLVLLQKIEHLSRGSEDQGLAISVKQGGVFLGIDK